MCGDLHIAGVLVSTIFYWTHFIYYFISIIVISLFLLSSCCSLKTSLSQPTLFSNSPSDPIGWRSVTSEQLAAWAQLPAGTKS